MARKTQKINLIVHMPEDKESKQYFTEVVSEYYAQALLRKIKKLYPNNPVHQQKALEYAKVELMKRYG